MMKTYGLGFFHTSPLKNMMFTTRRSVFEEEYSRLIDVDSLTRHTTKSIQNMLDHLHLLNTGLAKEEEVVSKHQMAYFWSTYMPL